jgi:hypothetical protein
VVVSTDDKSQIQGVDRTQPGLPLRPGKCGSMTYDDRRNAAATTLFAALNVLDGTVIGREAQGNSAPFRRRSDAGDASEVDRQFQNQYCIAMQFQNEKLLQGWRRQCKRQSGLE